MSRGTSLHFLVASSQGADLTCLLSGSTWRAWGRESPEKLVDVFLSPGCLHLCAFQECATFSVSCWDSSSFWRLFLGRETKRGQGWHLVQTKMKQEDVEDGGLSSMREGRQRQAQANKNKQERRFPFPFPPYDIQQQFMDEMYAVLDKGGLGIFESPTGTVRPCPSLLHSQSDCAFLNLLFFITCRASR